MLATECKHVHHLSQVVPAYNCLLQEGWGPAELVQELTLESGTGQLTGQDKPQQDRAGRAGQSTSEQD
jgi:hypothetical protein